MAKKKQLPEYKVFNRQIILVLSLFIVLLIFSINCFLTNEIDFALLLLIGAILVFLISFSFPLYFVFSPKSITVVWLLPFKKTIHWSSINNIHENKWFSSIDHLPNYSIMYVYNHKGNQIIKEFDIPRNKRTKKFIEKYAKYKIIWE